MKNKNTYLPLLIIAFIIASVASIGCLSIDDSAEKEAQFKRAVDTIYTKRLKAYNFELDSICELSRDSLVQNNIDSIRQVRMEEIKKLIKK